MEQSQAQRRLVKSLPELWAELSSEDSLGRHLAEFGEIRITRVEPETTVAWEGDRASGTVQISPTGWGTQVTLTATAVAEPVVAEPQVIEPVGAEPQVIEPVELRAEVIEPVEPEAEAVEPVEPVAAAPAPVAMISLREPDPQAQSATPEPDPPPRGFFSRLFRRPAPASLPPEQSEVNLPVTKDEIPAPPAPAPDPSPPTPGPDPTPPGPGPPDPAPLPPPVTDPVPPGPGPDPSPPTIEMPLEPLQATACKPEPASLAMDPERTVAILTEVLDDLGAAHHRPFSRG